MKHSELLKRAQSHFKAMDPRRIEIPEWPDEEGNPSVIFSKPMTIADIDILKPFEDKKEYDARLLVRKAITADDQPAFLAADLIALSKTTSAEVVSRLALAINLYSGPEVEDLKN